MLPRPARMVLDSVLLLVTVSVGVPVAVIVTILGALIFLPLPATIPPPKPLTSITPSQVYDRNGNLIATFHQFDERIPVTEKDIPPVLKEAVVAIEDRNFYQHGGVDIRGSLRALFADLNGKSLQGGSTITQQYVKLTYTNGQRTLARKIREAILASKLDRSSSKDEILFQYLNTIYFGDGSYGIGAASENYFRIPVSQLNVSQAALLAGLIAAPSSWAPRENPSSAEDRRVLVLDKMLQQGYITQEEHDAAVGQPVTNLAAGQTANPAETTVYPPQQDKPKYPAFVDYLLRWLLQKYGPQMVYQGGLRVQTTLDPAVQAEAEASVQASLKGTAEPLEMALATVEPQTGFVDAIVGGRDFGGAGPYAQVNFALGGCEAKPAASVTVEVPADCWNGVDITSRTGIAGRQPGSAWKPFVLATAFAEGIPPTRVYPAPRVYVIPNCKPSPTNPCTISNNEGEGGGASTIRVATVLSINTVYAQLIRDTGCVQVAQMAQKLGITSAWYSSQVQTCSGAYALGEVGVSPLDMASAYGVFDNHGARAVPTPVLKVIDGGGKVLVDNISTPPHSTQVIDPIIADNVTDVLRGVITSGTGTGANIGRPAAGKTGTTSKFTNAWFVGYTPSRSTAVWMGYANNQSTSLVLPGVGNVFGGTVPASTWKSFMSASLAKVTPTDFSQPPPLQSLTDQLNTQARGGINPGAPVAPADTPLGGPYVVGSAGGNVVLPAPSTTLPPATTVPSPTTSTTLHH
ncbi:MAG TPA: transglycosylase domain-containing protein [Acidimicrobiales bacterium]|nr:transglycosylase domain-containing protein [Acidimicrobiales bacterium]